jgi:UPF0755 protein
MESDAPKPVRIRVLPTLREKVFQRWGRHLLFGFFAIAAVLIAIVLLHATLFGPPSTDATREDFIVEQDETLEEVALELEELGFVKYSYVFKFAYTFVRTDGSIRPGGYKLSRDMDVWTIGKTLGQAPYLSWVTIPSGKRKEEVATILMESLGWTKEQREEWLSITETNGELTEGVFFPDTYLVPSDQPPAQLVARLRGRFEEAVAPYASEIIEQKLSWPELVALASIVEKESAKNDKPLVAGILWNRINKNMMLQVDVTLQYIQGTEEKWWPAPDPELKGTTSPYNTYKYVGLPPQPIATPSLESIEAVLRPQKTACLYYLHDNNGRIHCSTNYKAHVANVNRYLK